MSEVLIYLFSFGFVGLLWYYMKRYGPVKHSWMNISREQQRELKRMHRGRRTMAKSRPVGKPLYRKGLLGHHGLAIYSNGLYGKFGLGKTGRPRFRSFNEIEAIYPVEMEGFGQTYRKLQVESSDCLVLLIDERAHDMEKVVSLIRQQTDWERLYHGDEIIYGSLKEGYVGLHNSLRKGLPAWSPPGVVASAPPLGRDRPDHREEWAPEGTTAPWPELDRYGTSNIDVGAGPVLDAEGVDRSKGTLLAVEPPELVERRCRIVHKTGLIILALALFPIIIYLQFFGYDIFLCFPTGITLLLALLGFVLLKSTNIKKPLRIYTNGIEQPMVKDGEYFFVPYGNMISISESRNFLDGEYYSLTAKPIQNGVNIPKDFPDVERLIEFIRTRIGRPELRYRVVKPTIKGLGNKVEWFEYTLAIVVVIAVTWWTVRDAFETWEDRASGALLMGPPFLIVVIFIMGWHVISLKRRTGAPNGIQLKLVGAIYALTLLAPFGLALGLGGDIGIAAVCFPLNLVLVILALALLRWKDRKAFPPEVSGNRGNYTR